MSTISRDTIRRAGVSKRFVITILKDLLTTTGLTVLAIGAAHAQEVIDGTTETVIGGGAGTQASPWNIGDTLVVGDTGTGALNISNGGSGGIVTSDEAFIGNTATGNGTVTVDGAGSDWTSSNQIWVGYEGIGALTISGGATVSDLTGNIAFGTASTGTVVVTGTGSTWENTNTLYVSEGGTGYLTVSDGGTVSVTTNGRIRIANDAGSYGEATVTGASSSLDVSDGTLTVGYSGTGVLNIQDSATVTADQGFIGRTGTAVGTVNVDTSGTLDLSATGSSLTIGYDNGSQGTLNIDDGTVEVGNVTMLGDRTGSEGTIEITGASGLLETRHLDVGDNGTGTLNVTDGTVTVNFPMTVGVESDGVGTVVNDGGTINVGLTLTVGEEGTAAVTIRNGGSLGVSDETQIGRYAGSTGSLTVNDADMTGDNILVGNAGTGTLTAEAGATVAGEDVILGNDTTGNGTLNVTGAGTTLDVGVELTVGLGGTGTLNVSNGGSILVADSVRVGTDAAGAGTINIDGASSEITSNSAAWIGDDGTGTVALTNGAHFYSVFSAYIGNGATGTGTLTLDGSGTYFESANDIYTGSSGSGTMTVSNGAQASSEDGTIASSATSSGTVTVTGSGSSWTNSRLLFVGVGGNAALSALDGGTVSSSNGADVAYYNSSTSSVMVDGTGSSWSDDTLITVGRFGAGTLTISDGGRVSVASGSGELRLAESTGSTGTLNIGAASGDTAVAAGTVDASSVGFGDGTGTIVFNHTDTAYDFEADVNGDGAILHQAGATILSGDSSGFTGTTDVSGGTFYVSGVLAGTVNISGATVGGSGAIGNLTLGSGGNLAPGNSIGTLNVSNIAFNTGSTYTVELNDGGFVGGTNNDLLNASGTVTINGGTVHVTPENGTDDGSTYAAPGTYTIITASSVTGTFDSSTPTDDYIFLDFALGYDNSNVYVTSEQVVFFSDIARTPNQQAIADPLEALGSGNAVYDALVGLVGSDGDARAAFDSLTGEIHAAAQTALLEDSRFPREAAMDRLRVALGGVGADNKAQIENRISEIFGIWGQGFGSWSRWNSDGNAAAMDRTIGGFILGGDALVWDTARLGVLGSYSRAHVSVDDRASSGTADTYTLGAYGGGEWNAFTLTGGLAHSWHSLDTSRSVAFSGFTDNLGASYNARTLQAWGEAAYSLEAGAARFEPFANLAYVHLSTDDFAESGGAAALTVASNSVYATFTTLGLRAETDVAFGEVIATLRGMAGWRHAFGRTPTAQMTFASGGNAFDVESVPLAQDSLLLDAGVDVNVTDSATLGFAYGGQFGSGVQDHSAKASLNVRF